MEPTDPLQHLPEYLLGYRDLRQLKHQPPGMPHQPAPNLMSLTCTLRNDQSLMGLPFCLRSALSQ